MGLSYDLISEFVKITNDKKEGPKEGTVYATVVNSTGGKYVKIDGSDLLTPIDTTTGIEDGERVTVMIKDHKATVTGNITSPSVGKGTVNSLVGAVVDENLVGINADIENLIAKNAYLENVFAQNSIVIDSKIENLIAKDTYLENTYAENATIIDSKIENLEATDSRIENSVIENFQVIDGVVQDLKATNADIKVLNADFAQIKTLVNGNLTSDNILSFNLTSEKVTVDDAFIKDAMIDTISAGKINAGKINTNSVSIGSEDGGMLITGSTQQFMDKNGNVRIQIGKDASGDFTFILYGENGQGQIINQNGITASAIGDGLIVNNMVSDNAAISGGKLDISSVITEINSDDSTTIKSSKIYLNEQAQSLEVAFNSLKTKVDTIQEITIEGDLTAIVEQVQSNTSKIEANKNSINTLISQDTVIKKQVTDLQGTVAKNEETLSAKYTSLSQNLDGFKTTVADTYATKSSVTDVVDNIEANYSTTSVMNSAIEQKAQEISASVSSTYATKNQVNTLDNTLRQDYSTTQQMESAINVAKQEINLGVSSIYETKENTTSKIQNAVDDIQVGGTNLWVLLDLKSGYESNGNITSSGVQHKTRNTIIPTNGAKHLIYQCWNPNKVSNGSNTNRVAFFNSSKAYISSTQVLVLNGQTYQWQIINIPENASYVRLGAICGSADKYDTTIKIKFEFGNKPTDYSLAPEDVINDISTAKTEAITSANDTLTTTISNYYTKSQTDSQINVAKEAINLGVSTTYETKENVQTKVTSTLNSAKSYADTKKSEAISTASSDATSKANKAKDDAIKSANNTLNTTIANYYTKTQTDSQINIAKEAIDLSVSTNYETKANVTSKINNINIGSVNKLKGTSKSISMNINNATSYETRDPYFTPNKQTLSKLGFKNGDTITLGFNWEISKNGSNNFVYGNFRTEFVGYSNSGSLEYKGDIKNPVATFSSSNTKGRSETTITLTEANLLAVGLRVRIDNSVLTLTLSNVKLEKGNKATSWSPAPEDVDSNISTAKSEAISTASSDATSKANKAKDDAIKSANNTLTTTIANYYTKEQTDSQIKIAKDEINLGVSNTYETKSNVTSKVDSTLKSAKSYADTKKSEAISTAASDATSKANKAKTDAINTASSDATSKANKAKDDAIKSANNTLTSTIANYYTKTQTDSQINIAKEAIDLSVSTNYETKANVESKIKGISVGGTNLAFDTNKGITSWGWGMQTNGGKTITEYLADGVKGVKLTKDANDSSGWNYVSYGRFKRDKITPATTYVVSFEIKSNRTFNINSIELKQGDSSNNLIKTFTAVQNKVTANSTAWTKIIFRLVTLDTLPSSTNQVIYITGFPGKANSTHYIRNLKLEVGNTPTAWSPAPEDITSDITTAKNDAISSANNTLTSTIANYYTKTQTDSQINIAKNAINLSVSETYETKTNVTSKVDSTLKSAKSYADTKKSEAISTASNDATSKANKAKTDAINTAASDATSKANKAKDDAIKSAAADATSKVNKINVGSVNLLAGTGTPYSCNINTTSGFETRDPYFTPNKQTLSELGFKKDDQITLSFNWEISKNGSNNFVYGDFRAEFVGADGNYKGVIKNPVATFSASNTKGRSEATVTLNETSLSAVGLRIRVDNSVLTLNLSNVKMEKGNKATSWSPAPEDIESDITAIESETKSIKQTVSSLVVGTDSINASVKSLEESMVNTTNGLASDISRIQDQVNLKMTSDDVKLEIQKEMSKGASKVSTSTGFTFDQNGLNISKTDSEMKTQITEDGMKIYKNDDIMLTANNQGVDAKNLHATTYLIIGGNSRMEDFTESGSKRTAVFWIG